MMLFVVKGSLIPFCKEIDSVFSPVSHLSLQDLGPSRTHQLFIGPHSRNLLLVASAEANNPPARAPQSRIQINLEIAHYHGKKNSKTGHSSH
jgi:hypothetical protein